MGARPDYVLPASQFRLQAQSNLMRNSGGACSALLSCSRTIFTLTGKKSTAWNQPCCSPQLAAASRCVYSARRRMISAELSRCGRNVIDSYKFVCRSYQQGDRIYGFGFSRGAYTIRVVVKLILSQGLVEYKNNEAELHRRAIAAYRAFRKANASTGWRIENHFVFSGISSRVLSTIFHE
jgi:hypothetical protein